MRALDDFLPVHEFSERHRLAIDAAPERIDAAVREVSLRDIPLAPALWWLRRLGRPYGDSSKPFVAGELPGVVLADVPGEGIVLGLTGQLTETRVHVPDPEVRRRFRRDWLVIRPFSGLIRILFLRAARRRAES